MAGQLRSSVGFLGGGGVTPSTTPTPKARLARFILVPWGIEGEVQVLTDTYGRILTQYTQDGGYFTACVYVPGDGRLDWDDASEPELIRLLGKYGYNDALAIVNNNVTIGDHGETETLIWDDTAMDFTVDIDMFQNGAQNMYFRTVNDGSRDVTVLVDADGKAIMAPTLNEYTDVLFSVANNGTEIDTITEGDSISAAGIIQACGGSVNVTALDAGSSVFLLIMGTHVQYCNADNLTTTPTVTPSTIINSFRVNNNLLEYLDDNTWRKVTWKNQLIPARLVEDDGEYVIEFEFTPSPMYDINNFNIVTNGTVGTGDVIEAQLVINGEFFEVQIGEYRTMTNTVGDSSPFIIYNE